jgi:UDP-N-acetylglucosamine 4,6-dehydratase
MKILITGGSGYLGQELVKQLYPNCSRIVVYSRSESRQAEMKQRWPEYPDNIMRYRIGDIRDISRMAQAMRDCEYVVHAAALKRVEVCEYDPFEAVKTNVVGTMNVAEACNIAGIKKCVYISTDKAVSPHTLYGSTKFCGEKLMIASNNMGHCRFSCVRYANVKGSTGSCLTIWDKQCKENKPLTVTDKRMTRMWITQEDAARLIVRVLGKMQGGEVFIPNCTGTRLIDTIREQYGNHPIVETGIRPSEKLHEDLISESDARDCWFDGMDYVLYPAEHQWTKDLERRGHKQPEDFRLRSNSHVTSDVADILNSLEAGTGNGTQGRPFNRL